MYIDARYEYGMTSKATFKDMQATPKVSVIILKIHDQDRSYQLSLFPQKSHPVKRSDLTKLFGIIYTAASMNAWIWNSFVASFVPFGWIYEGGGSNV